MLHGCFRRAISWIVPVLAVVAACANSGKSPPPDSILPGDDASASSSSGGRGPNGGPGDASVPTGDDGSGIIVFHDSGAATGDACQHFDVQFVPKVPLVDVLVDRSGSMFQVQRTADGGMSDEWDPLKTATLSVIQTLQSQVAFGFTAYTGINPSTTAGMCPVLVTVPAAVNNYQAIATVYTPLGQPSFKAETPAQKSLEAVAQSLAQVTTITESDGGPIAGQPGGKYILFVTDGETDFCDDGNAVCPADAVIAEIQKLYGNGITTLVLGVGSDLSNISVPVLQSFANAGSGLPANAPPSSAQGMPLAPGDIFNQCNGVAGWSQLLAASGATTGALGNYTQAPTTNATVFSPSATDVGDLSSKIAAALSTVKSCSFDIQGKIKVDLAQASKGRVSIDGTAVPFDPNNGWTMTTDTQIDLLGSACAAWRATGKDISFDFPCDVIIVLQ